MRRSTWLVLTQLTLLGCGGNTTSKPGETAAHVYFLQFEGATLQPGADNPVTNTSSLVDQAVTVPSYLPGDGSRVATIGAIVNEVAQILAPYDISVVSTRPSSAEYDMIIVGGSPGQAGFPGGTVAVSPTDCSGQDRYVSLLFDTGLGQHDAARRIISALGITHAIPTSRSSADCMCSLGPECASSLVVPCTIGAAGTPISVNTPCSPGATVMDEHQEFIAKFGAYR